MGWTRKSYRAAQLRASLLTVFLVLLLTAVERHLENLGAPGWTIAAGYAVLFALAYASGRWCRRRFERSAEPTAEQRKAWEKVKKRNHRCLLVLGPGAVASVVLISLPLPWYIAIAPFTVSFAVVLFMLRGPKSPTKQFEETLIWFDESWDESPLAEGDSRRDPAALAR